MSVVMAGSGQLWDAPSVREQSLGSSQACHLIPVLPGSPGSSLSADAPSLSCSKLMSKQSFVFLCLATLPRLLSPLLLLLLHPLPAWILGSITVTALPSAMTRQELAVPCLCHPLVPLPWNINATNHKRQPELEEVWEQGWDSWWLCPSPQGCVLLPERAEQLNPPLKVGRWKGRAVIFIPR